MDMEIQLKGHLITLRQWIKWREAGRSNKEIALALGVSGSSVRNMARQFRKAGYCDPMYDVRSTSLRIPDVSTEQGAYILGILWGTTTRNEEGYIVRHRNPWFVETVKEHLNTANTCYVLETRTGMQTSLNINATLEIRRVDDLLLRNGWQPRNATERPYPCGDVHDGGFVRAWIELHSSIDIARIGRKRMPRPRLRIYGNRFLMEEINLIISSETGLQPMRLQKTPNEITKALYYHGSSARAVYDWMYHEPAIYCEEVRGKFADILAA